MQVGDRHDSDVYIKMKRKAAEDIGINADHLKLPKFVLFSLFRLIYLSLDHFALLNPSLICDRKSVDFGSYNVKCF